MNNTWKKINNVLTALVLVLLLFGCKADILEEFPAETQIQEVKFEFEGEFVVDPNLLIINLFTEKGEVKNARTTLSKNAEGKFESENFPLEYGDYTALNWIAYDTISNSSIAKTAVSEVPFAVVEGSNTIIQPGEKVLLTAKEIPFEQFSLLNPNTLGHTGLVTIEGGDIFLTSYFGPNMSRDTDYFRMNTKGDVQYRVVHDMDYFTSLYFLNNTASGKIISAYGISYGPNFYRKFLIFHERFVNIVNPEDGSDELSMHRFDYTRQTYQGSLNPDFNAFSIIDIQATPDDGFITYNYFHVGARVYDITKFSSSGNVEWKKEFDIGTNRHGSTKPYFWPVIGVQDDGRFMVKTHNSRYPFLYHFESTGEVINEIDFTGNSDTEFYTTFLKIIATKDGGYLLAGADYSTRVPRYVKLDSEGTIEWVTTLNDLPHPLENNGRYIIVSKGADDSIICSLTLNDEGKSYVKFLRIDTETGQIIDQTTEPIGGEGIPGDAYNYCGRIIETNNDDESLRGIVGVGKFAPAGSNSNIPWIFKIPSNFEEVDLDLINDPTTIVFPN